MVVVLADNGASPERYTEPGFDRPSETRDGRHTVRRPLRARPRGHLGLHRVVLGQCGEYPFRYWKAEEFEGGCHTPMIVQWPKGLKSPAGSITGQMGHVIDLMPTFLELAGWPAIAVYSFSGGGCSLTRTYCWGQKSPG